jgi:hypothetical protein
MTRYTIPAREIPLDDSWDVIVVGGGPAGCAAATAAAREGARTLLVEATGALGGMGTSGLVPALAPYSDGETLVYQGLARRVLEKARAAVPHEPEDKTHWVAINPESLKRLYDDLVTEAGAKVMFMTALAAVESSEGDVDALVVANKAGLSALKAKVYVDCTGDADLAVWAGAEYEQGEGGSGELQPATLCFILSNVDDYAFQHLLARDRGRKDPVLEMIKSGRYPDIVDPHFCRNLIGPSTVGFNSGHLWDVDNTDPMSISGALMRGRQVAESFRRGLAEFAPETFGNAFLATTGSLMGIRETRRIVGDYCLTLKDYQARAGFPDEIARNNYWIDIHTAKGEVARSVDQPDHVKDRFEKYGPGESHGIPYRCLRPKGLRNVLVAGRSISCDRPVQGAVRVMPCCLAMGEAAGLAAAMAGGAEARDVHAVDTDQLRAKLREYGAYLP